MLKPPTRSSLSIWPFATRPVTDNFPPTDLTVTVPIGLSTDIGPIEPA